jgi:hypothetical protein
LATARLHEGRSRRHEKQGAGPYQELRAGRPVHGGFGANLQREIEEAPKELGFLLHSPKLTLERHILSSEVEQLTHERLPARGDAAARYVPKIRLQYFRGVLAMAGRRSVKNGGMTLS